MIENCIKIYKWFILYSVHTHIQLTALGFSWSSYGVFYTRQKNPKGAPISTRWLLTPQIQWHYQRGGLRLQNQPLNAISVIKQILILINY